MTFIEEHWNRRLLVPESLSGLDISTKLLYDSRLAPTTNEKVVGANTIQLNASESSQDGYYEDFDIILKKPQPDGTTYSQSRRILAYSGTHKIATIDGVWDVGFEPAVGDSYEIVLAYPDQRVSNNTAIQVLDYISSPRYGRDLSITEDVRLDTWKAAARKCDARSDVSLRMAQPYSVEAGDVYTLLDAGKLIWEGAVRETATASYINFTQVLGKITHKWNSWKYRSLGEIIYSSGGFYRVTTAGVKAAEPVHGSGTVNGLEYISALTITKVSGAGPASLSLDLDANPVLALNEAGEEISGYSLYDSDSVSYWRLMGWDEHTQDNATLYQTNFTIDTSSPMFDNMNMMLEHCNGIFSYSAGKYTLEIESIEEDIIPITADDIIGSIRFDDSGIKSSYNSVTVSYSDPGNNFESKNISLFSKTFLQQDRNVPKKGNITVSGITNYYNVRLLADSYLKRSRFNSSIVLTLFPEFMELKPGSVIGITHPRYSWDSKKFRVDTFTLNPNGTVTIIAKEYSPDFYSLTNLNKIPDVGSFSAPQSSTRAAPANVQATDSSEVENSITITWEHPVKLNPTTEVQIFSGDNPNDTILVAAIGSTNFLFTSGAGPFAVGQRLVALNSANGFIKDKTYYVVVVNPNNANAIKVSDTPGGPVIGPGSVSSPSISFTPFFLVGSVAYPATRFNHFIEGLDSSEVTRYYKVRYKIKK